MKNKFLFGFEDLTLRAVVFGAAGSVLFASSSCYVALRMGALPWPTIFVSLLSLALIRPFSGTLREANVTATGMSAGGLVAGGLAFSLPGFWMENAAASIPLGTAMSSALAGAIIGVFCCARSRSFFVEESNLPFPMGQAAADTLKAGYEGGKSARMLFASCGASSVFTCLRDLNLGIPPVLALGKGFSLWLSPMAFSIGYIIGPLYMGSWLAGSLAGHWVFPAFGVGDGVRNSIGVGLILGSGLAASGKSFASFYRNIKNGGTAREPVKAKKTLKVAYLAAALAVAWCALSLGAAVPVWAAFLAVVIASVMTLMASALTGQTGIDPMEIFAILALLMIGSVFPLGSQEAFLIAAVVATATGLAGDALQDLKAGAILGTDPRAQLVTEGIGGVVGAVVATGVLYALKDVYGAFGPGTDMPAPQAFAVMSLFRGMPDMTVFWGGAVCGAVLTLFGVPGMTLGIGVYLPPFISLTAAIGGIARYVVRRYSKCDDTMMIVSSGLLGGEGITGVLIAFARFAAMSF